jgi:hypothetical protein
MCKISSLIFVGLMIGCENIDQKDNVQAQNYDEWHSDYINARQSDDISDLCSEYFQDCIDAGYPEESCSIRLEECEDYNENADREDEDEETSEDNSVCEEEAQVAFDDCVEEGGSSEDCRLVYAETYDECIGRD